MFPHLTWNYNETSGSISFTLSFEKRLNMLIEDVFPWIRFARKLNFYSYVSFYRQVIINT